MDKSFLGSRKYFRYNSVIYYNSLTQPSANINCRINGFSCPLTRDSKIIKNVKKKLKCCNAIKQGNSEKKKFIKIMENICIELNVCLTVHIIILIAHELCSIPYAASFHFKLPTESNLFSLFFSA